MELGAIQFKLSQVIDAIESASETVQWYANTETGQVDCYADPDYFGEEYEEGAFEGREWLRMPDSRDRDDWGGMRDFAYALGGDEGEALLDAIHGRGAFRAFRRVVEEMGALESWYAYKDERLCGLAEEWLESHGLSWIDDRHENRKRDWRSLLPAVLRMHIELDVLEARLSVCKFDALPSSLPDGGFYSIVRTGDEISVVCETGALCDGAAACEDGWRAFKVRGPLDFGLVGILAKISSSLSEADVPLFAISTFDTDYILVKEENLEAATAALRGSGCIVNG